MRQTKSFTVNRDGDEVTYQCTQLGAWDGSKALIRAQKIAVSGINGLDALIQAMTPEDFDYFSHLFAKATMVTYQNDHGKTVKKSLHEVFDVFFSGQYFEMVQWLVFCLGQDFGKFFFLIQNEGEKIKLAWTNGAGKSADTAPETPDSSADA